MTDARDPMTDAVRRLADAQPPSPLTDAELDRLLAAIPEPVPERPTWARGLGWAAIAAAAVLAVWLLPQQGGEPGAPLEAEPTPAAIADATPSEPPQRIEMRLATADPSIEIVWVIDSDFEIR